MFSWFALAAPGGGAGGGGFTGGGGSWGSGFIELPGLVEFSEIFASWLKALSGFWEALNVPLGVLIPNVGAFRPAAGMLYLLGLEDATLLGLILGGALSFYIIYQLVTWLLNIIT